ncbi:branched-chain amino acid ABC transporter permease [Myceligenerans salitolerans]|uniref:Branched-chain amino acid ABC transporter permease n=1 Tax=Myceligenerans salitolerans TaxID=1230528 RepID=A0ABS3I5D9_9MICO|nr:branched-chain amino acid ABC transporter permease [Myceligenerans salitolerans]MBO0607589.1 branched-chain amino acid ABC transporter permease [Myceligenerans salitolerans]
MTRRIVLRAALVTLVALAATFLLDPYWNFQVARFAACFAAVAGLTVLVGLTGQLSLGHSVLMAAGGYGYAFAAGSVTGALGDSPAAPYAGLLAGLLGGLVAAGALGALLGAAAARLHGPYLAGLTLALVIALPSAAVAVPGLGGDQGLGAPFVPVPDALAALMYVEHFHAVVAIVVAAAAVTPLMLLRAGRQGLRMRAVLGHETAARLSGVNPGLVKAGAFTASSLAAGLGGAVIVMATQSVSPGAFGLTFSMLLVVGAVIGGLGSIGGAAVGAALVVLLPWAVETVLDQLPAGLPPVLAQRLDGNLAVILTGAIVITVIAARPGGVAQLLTPRTTARPTASHDTER